MKERFSVSKIKSRVYPINSTPDVNFQGKPLFDMSSDDKKLTIRESYRNAVRSYHNLESLSERQDLESFQKQVAGALSQFRLLQTIVDSLSLFSENEDLREINTSYISFVAIPYYESCLYMKLLANVDSGFQYDLHDKLKHKLSNLQSGKVKVATFLHLLDSFGGVLTKEQTEKLHSFKRSYNPSVAEINALTGNPATRRAEKIANFNLQRELKKKLEILDSYYSNGANEDEEDDVFGALDEEIVRNIFVDQLKLFSIFAFENLELIALELQVLENRPHFEKQQLERKQQTKNEEEEEFGYTTKVEANPNKPKKISDLITKQGKILQPFTITNDRQELRKKVFGTGQVLPSMTVEEYLDYELANGKLAKGDTNVAGSSDEEDSEDEREKREWDDWKDDNPKGSGNIKGNIG